MTHPLNETIYFVADFLRVSLTNDIYVLMDREITRESWQMENGEESLLIF